MDFFNNNLNKSDIKGFDLPKSVQQVKNRQHNTTKYNSLEQSIIRSRGMSKMLNNN
jgi:hypothetical protein